MIAVAMATLLGASAAVSLGIQSAGASSGSNWPYVFPGIATWTPLTSDPAGGVAAHSNGSSAGPAFNVQLSPTGTVDWNDTAADPTYLDHLPVYDDAGNAYYTRCNGGSCTVEKHGPTGQPIWPADGTSNLGAVTGNAIALSPDGVVYAFTTDRRLVGLNAATGAPAFAPVTVSDYIVSDQKILFPYPSAVALVTASQVAYYTAQGSEVATYSIPNSPTATTSAGDGSVELAWGSCSTQSISIERVTPSGIQWSKTIPGPNCTGNGDPVALGALPDGGIAVAYGGDGTILPTVTLLSPDGSVRWANALPLASGTTAVTYPDPQLAVDTSGNIVVGLNTTWQCQSGHDTCWAVQAFTYTASGAPLNPPIDLQVPDPNPQSYGNPLSGLAIAPGRIYLASSHFTGGQYSAGPTDYEINQVDIPGIGPVFPEGKNWPAGSGTGGTPPPPSSPQIDTAALLAPSATDHMLRRGLSITLAPGSPSASSFEYGWAAPGSTSTAPTTSTQTCTNVSGNCSVSFSDTNPSETGWHLFVRAVGAGGAGPWVLARSSSGSTEITIPPKPMVLALGDSVTSGHHRDTDLSTTYCNDPSYGYPFWVSTALQASLPSKWQLGGYINLARSGFSTSDVLTGGKDACQQSYIGSSPEAVSTPIADAINILQSPAHAGSWNHVVITAGIDDTNWGPLLINIASNSKVGRNSKYTEKQCANDLKSWTGWPTVKGSAVPNIKIGVSTIAGMLTRADSGVQVTWRSYYDIAGTGGAPSSCDQPFESAIKSLSQTIQGSLPTGVRFVNTDASAIHDNGSLIQPLLITNVAAGVFKWEVALPGWPHPNSDGAKLMAQQVAP
jgi:hypothetical protein